MKKIIENIRNKPSHHIDRIVWICAAIAAALLLATWLIIGNGHKNNANQSFFQTFNEGVEEGKNVIPSEIESNLNAQP